LTAVCALAFASVPAHTETVEEFYRGKQIKITVGFDAGTDYDQWARLIAHHLGDHLPGHPTFVVQNMGAAGGILMTNNLYNVAPRDGTVIGMIGRNLPYFALVHEKNAQFDPARFNWIGSPELTNRVCVSTDRAAVHKADDLFEHELVVGGSGAGSAVSTTPVLLSRLLGMKFRLVEGYPAPAAVMLAMDRGEVEGLCQSLVGILNGRPGFVEQGKWHILFNMERTPLRDLRAPSIFSFAKTDEQRQIISLFSSSIELGRPIAAPPGVPPERVEALRRGFEATMADPALVAEAKQQKFEVNVVTGAQLGTLVGDLMTTPPAVIARMKDLLKP
jgi:tripartite-type tricarboxylate transporter receptor subunit TctC